MSEFYSHCDRKQYIEYYQVVEIIYPLRVNYRRQPSAHAYLFVLSI